MERENKKLLSDNNKKTVAKPKDEEDKTKLEVIELDVGQKVLGGKYEVVKLIAKGAYGSIYEVRDDSDKRYGMKVQSASLRYFDLEATIMCWLRIRKSLHFLNFYTGKREGEYAIIVMQLAGKNLNEVRETLPKRKFSGKRGIDICIQCLDCVQLLHSVGFLHRDLKPGNFCFSLEDPSLIVLIDFGLARRYADEKTGIIRKPRFHAPFRGTVRYAALATHHGREYGCKEDLESWFYVIVEMLVGTLPWYTMEDEDHVAVSKQRARTTNLKEFLSGCPKSLIHVIQYIDDLRYYDIPDYSLIRGLLKKAMEWDCDRYLEEKKDENSVLKK